MTSSEFDDSEPSVIKEAVERREAPRGPLRGLVASLPGAAATEVLEAGNKDFFVAVSDPERYTPGDTFPVTVRQGERSFACSVEVVRIETAPRRGLALRILHMTPDAELVFASMRG